MEEKLYFYPYHDEFHEVFPGYSPCECHTTVNPYTKYSVQVTVVPAIGGGKVAKEITIICENCGRSATFNVESLEIYEQDLKF